ncbi:glycosyltransferase family 4 protein [Galbibacter mesophilus]|uniref:glycosyltransferase family 4 protein n=1 Tax=Galbibacter mesophilus TaxID=379069 RepID=UPI00191E79D9|nr:glycosyltransferase family 4 protein [Galbibacter mesophilus]MCM5663422.1 glycosyltransferase family 4 protein [Galbibacter mesophilus]
MKTIIRVTTVPQSFSGLLKGQLKFMSNHYRMVAISSEGSGNKSLKEIAKQEDADYHIVKMTRKITPWSDLQAVYKLYQIFKKEKPFVVHTHTPKAGTLGMLAAKLAGVKNRLHTVAGLPLVEAEGSKRQLLNSVERFTYHCATKVYPNSYGLSEIILKNKFTNPAKLSIIANGSSNGINLEYFNRKEILEQDILHLKKQLNITETDYVFIFVGRLVGDKGINELIKAFSDFSKKYDSAKLLLVGSYEENLDPLLPETVEVLENHPKIIPVGWQKDVRPYFRLAKALVFPSYREGFPNVVMQACAFHLPSIVSNINGCNEIIKDDFNGFIIPVKDEKAIYNAMEKMMSLSEEKHKEMSLNAYQAIAEKYDQKLVWQELLKEYQKLD